jgi:hypothetical protein
MRKKGAAGLGSACQLNERNFVSADERCDYPGGAFPRDPISFLPASALALPLNRPTALFDFLIGASQSRGPRAEYRRRDSSA